MTYEVADKPFLGGKRASKYAELKVALEALPADKCLKLPLDTFPGPVQAHIFVPGFKIRSKRTPEALFIWLEPRSEAKAVQA